MVLLLALRTKDQYNFFEHSKASINRKQQNSLIRNKTGEREKDEETSNEVGASRSNFI